MSTNLATLGASGPPPPAAAARGEADLAEAILGLAAAIDKHLRVTSSLMASVLDATRQAQPGATGGQPGSAPGGGPAADADVSLRVVLLFTSRARAFLEERPKPARVPQPKEVWPFQHLVVGDLVRVEGYTEIWQVSQRTWHVMADLSELRMVLDGPVR